MNQVWSFFFEFFTSAGFPKLWSETAAGGVCALAAAAVAVFVCYAMDKFVRRLIIRKADGSRHREKAIAFAVSARRFIFMWMLDAWLPGCFQGALAAVRTISVVLDVATVVLCASAVSAAIAWLQSVAHVRTGDKTFSSKTFAQVAKIVVWSIATIVVAAALMGKSPTFVLSGLGALTAVLMLIFREPILGLVAGIQAGQNDMVRLGDWITMQKYNADGTVIDIALTTIKVRNFDNTVTMIPAAALLSDAFVNWRYMSTSKGRRIKRPVWISVTSIRELGETELSDLVGKGLLEPGDRPVSNLAAFEMWLRRMLRDDETVSDELTCMVRQTEAGDTGIPVEVYCFTKTRDWEEYEAIQTEIFDRIFVTVPKFSLRIYQRTGDKMN